MHIYVQSRRRSCKHERGSVYTYRNTDHHPAQRTHACDGMFNLLVSERTHDQRVYSCAIIGLSLATKQDEPAL